MQLLLLLLYGCGKLLGTMINTFVTESGKIDHVGTRIEIPLID